MSCVRVADTDTVTAAGTAAGAAEVSDAFAPKYAPKHFPGPTRSTPGRQGGSKCHIYGPSNRPLFAQESMRGATKEPATKATWGPQSGHCGEA